MLGNVDLTNCPVPHALVLSKHISYLWMIRLLGTVFNGVGCYRLVFDLAVFFLPGVCQMFLYGVNVLDIYVALFIVCVLLG